MSETPTSFHAAQKIHEVLKSRQVEIETFIRALVETESPSGDETGSYGVVNLISDMGGQLGCIDAIRRVTAPDFGQHLVIEAFSHARSEGQILIVGHTDTVHARGSVALRPWRHESGKIYGPGIFDMRQTAG
jgi:glutamate carboxypeptidase